MNQVSDIGVRLLLNDVLRRWCRFGTWEDKSEMYVQVAIFSMVAFIRAERLEVISPDDHGQK